MKYNDTVKKLHEDYRENTVEKIQDAIETIKTFEGKNAVITAKKIMENTDLSRSVLYKPHSLKIWNPKLWGKRYGSNQEWKEKYDEMLEREMEPLQDEIVSMKKEIEKLKNTNKSLEESLENEKKRSDVYKMDMDELKMKNQRLLGECQRLQSKLFAQGITE